MKHEIIGIRRGLKPSQIKAFTRVDHRRLKPEQAVSCKPAIFLAELSAATRRQVGVLINRQGRKEGHSSA